MTILRGDRSAQPSWACIAPAMDIREGKSRRLFSLAALASASAMALVAAPALAAATAPVADGAKNGVSMPYAPLIGMQGSAPVSHPSPTPEAVTQSQTTATTPPAAASQPTAEPATDGAAPASQPAPTAAPPTAEAPPVAADAAAPATKPAPGDEHDIVVSAKNKAPPGDPMIGINLKSYAVVQAADKALIGPAAMVYKKSLPSPLRMGLHNVLVNLREPPVAFAFLVEHKFGKAFETLGRLAINSTIGVGGLFDMAKRKPFNLPWRPNGIADAMGFYGIKPGPYFFLPMVGPTTLRDLIGTTIDRVGFPALYADELRGPAYGLAVTIIGGLDDRVMIDPQVREFREHSPDPYNAMKVFYLTRRQAEIDALHGKPPLKDKPADYDFGTPAKADAPAPDAPAPAAAPTDATTPPPPVIAPPLIVVPADTPPAPPAEAPKP